MDPGGFACGRLELCVESWRERSEAGSGSARDGAGRAGLRRWLRVGVGRCVGEVREGGRRLPRSSVAQAAETLGRVLGSVTVGWSPLRQAFALLT